MTNELAVKSESNFGDLLSDIESMKKQVKALLETKHYQAIGEAGIFAILQKALSLNINSLEALNGGLYYVQGKVGMSTETMASLIRQKGHSIIKDAKSNNDICILHGRRADNGDTWTISFSMGDAQKAGLAKNMYDKYPAIMLYNRAMSTLARQLFPDIIKGAGYTLDELKEIAANRFPANSIEIQVDEMKEVKIDPSYYPKISKEQGDELSELLKFCDPVCVDTWIDYIKNPPFNGKDVYDLPLSMYDRFKKKALANREELVKKEMETVNTENLKEV